MLLRQTQRVINGVSAQSFIARRYILVSIEILGVSIWAKKYAVFEKV